MKIVKNTTAQNEITGEIRNVVILDDGSKYFDLFVGMIPFSDEDEKVWIVQVNPRSIEYWLTPAILLLIATVLTII